MHAIVIAGGRGTRLKSYSDGTPKALMRFGSQPLLEIIVRQLRQAGAQRVTLCVGYLGDQIERGLGNGERFGLSIDYSHETSPLGTAGPLRGVTGWSTPALVMNCDILTSLNFAALHSTHLVTAPAMTVATQRREVPVSYGVLEVSDTGLVLGITEKPALSVDTSSGIYVIDPLARALIPEHSRMDMPALVTALIDQGHPVRSYPFSDSWHDIGTPENYETATLDFMAAPDGFLNPSSLTAGEAR